jgi:two-component system, chemotaxis family, protein-glutamate methylesterase/glutaminase
MIRILLAEDSDTIALLLKALLEKEPDFEVVGRAKDGREAVRLNGELKPDLVTMDILMPVMDGFDATRLIMASQPVPIVVISSRVDDVELRTTFRAFEEGALAVIEKPPGSASPEFEAVRQKIVDTIRAMAEVRVVRRTRTMPPRPVDLAETRIVQKSRMYQIVAIGCSTGGPQALLSILSPLPVGFPMPIIITQHISKGFVGGFASWLEGNTLLEVCVADDRQALKPGTVYIAPDDRHLLVKWRNGGLFTHLDDGPKMNGFRPSVTPMLNSVAETCKEGRAIGVILTGMGVDGAAGLLAVRKAGGHTIIQDEKSAVVYGMPGAALAIDAADQLVKLDKMAAYLLALARS